MARFDPAAGRHTDGRHGRGSTSEGSGATRVRLEGFHAVKHALRFGARLDDVVTTDLAAVQDLARRLAPDLLDVLVAPLVAQVDEPTWQRLVGRRLPSPLFATCARPSWRLEEVLERPGPAVLLEDPTHLGNLGAVVRVAAAAGAAAVVTTGSADPWHPTAVRAAAGLHLAVPVVHGTVDVALAAAGAAGRTVVALDERGDDLRAAPLPDDALLALGSERRGLTEQLRGAADLVVAIPMQEGVASLNLATAAAVALYAR